MTFALVVAPVSPAYRCTYTPQCWQRRTIIGWDLVEGKDGELHPYGPPLYSEFCHYHLKVSQGLLGPIDSTAYPAPVQRRIERSEKNRLERLLEVLG